MRHWRRAVGGAILAALALGGLARDPAPTGVGEPPEVAETLAAVGRRLSASRSAKELTRIARRGDELLHLLTRQERDALGRGLIRFRIDRPAVVEIAAPAGSVPFWLADQGFAPAGRAIGHPEGPFLLFRKTAPAGTVGLGVNGLDRSPPAHYAVFVRDPEGGPPPAVHALRPDELEVVPAGEGVSPFSDVQEPFASLPPELRGAVIVRTAHDRRHAALLLRGRAWKTHVPSGPSADQVAISFGADAARQLTFTWRTSPEVTETALRLAVAAPGRAEPSGSVRLLRGDSRPIARDGLLNDPLIRRHHVAATDLEPDTTYTYSLGDGSPGRWTPWRTVRTGPSTPRDFSLLAIGDPQTGLEAWGRLIQAARDRHPEAGALLIAGDLVDRGNERTNWDHFFLRARPVFETLPVMPAVGNHEYLDQGPHLYRETFALPANGPRPMAPNLAYSFEYADAFVAVLDSTAALYDPENARLQAEWLDAALSRTRKTWRIVQFHHPVYASHPSRESPALRDAWVPVFDRNRVDLVLQGHDHAYLRTYALRGGKPVCPPERGTVYLVSVSGDKYCDQDPRDYTARGLTHISTYQVLDFHAQERRLTCRAFDADGRELDFLEIAPAESRVSRDPDPRSGGVDPGRAVGYRDNADDESDPG